MQSPSQITPRQLLTGYANGVFPMAGDANDPQLYWYDPPLRGVLPVGRVHASRSLLRRLRRERWTADAAPDFGDIVRACADRSETWINAPLAQLYGQLHDAGHAYALAVHHGGRLAGGIFGVTLGGAFFGESMFSRQTDGSKMALVWLSHHLAQCGFVLFDTQYLTGHLARMGGQEITRAEYHKHLDRALQTRADFRAYQLPDAAALLSALSPASSAGNASGSPSPASAGCGSVSGS